MAVVSGNTVVTQQRHRVDCWRLWKMLGKTYWDADVALFDVLKRVNEADRVVTVLDRGYMVGFGRRDLQGDALIIRDVIVDEMHRREGVGTLVMQELMREPYPPEAKRFELLTDDAGAFYEALGFKRWGDKMYARDIEEQHGDMDTDGPAD